MTRASLDDFDDVLRTVLEAAATRRADDGDPYAAWALRGFADKLQGINETENYDAEGYLEGLNARRGALDVLASLTARDFDVELINRAMAAAAAVRLLSKLRDGHEPWLTATHTGPLIEGLSLRWAWDNFTYCGIECATVADVVHAATGAGR